MELFVELLALGVLVGTIGTIIGAGGGFILLPVLILLFHIDQPEKLTAISLAIVFVNATSGTFAYARMKRIDYKAGLAFAAATIPGAIAGAIVTYRLRPEMYNGIFGALLLAVSIVLVVRPYRKEPSHVHGSHNRQTHTIVEVDGTTHTFSFNLRVGVIISFFVGFISSLLGIGGGIVHVPMMTYLLNFPVHIATATSQFVLAIMSLVGTIVHVVNGTFGSVMYMVIPLSIGALAGAQVGARLSGLIRGQWIIRLLALALASVAIRILFMAFL